MMSLKWFQPWVIVCEPMLGHEKGSGCDVTYLTMGSAVWLPVNALPDVRDDHADDGIRGGEHAQGEK